MHLGDVSRGEVRIHVQRAHYLAQRSSLLISNRLYQRLAQGDANYRPQIEGDNAVPSSQVKRIAGIGDQEFRVGAQRIVKNGMRNRFVVQQGLTLGITARGHQQLAIFVLQKNVSALATSQLERRFQQSH